MRRHTPSLLAAKLLRASSLLRSPSVLAPRASLFHHEPNNAHHLLDETPHGRAPAIVRALRSASSSGNTDRIACLHCASIKSGAVLDPPICTSLLAAYARAGRGSGAGAGAALALFHEAVAPDVILCNAAIGTLTTSCQYDAAAILFRRMARELGEFDSTTVVIMLSGASRAGNLRRGIILFAVLMCILS